MHIRLNKYYYDYYSMFTILFKINIHARITRIWLLKDDTRVTDSLFFVS